MRPARIAAIDATRGAAMLFVCLSHFLDAWYGRTGDLDLPWRLGLKLVTMTASPTFMVVGGTMAGFLYATRRASFPAVRLKLADRGLFMLTVGHLLIVAAHLPLVAHPLDVFRFLPITDAIGLSVLVGPALLERTSTRARVALGGGLFAASWIVAALWQPNSMWKEVLVGSTGQRELLFVFPLAPWCALYLASTAVGERIGALQNARQERLIGASLARVGAIACASAVAMGATYRLLFRHAPWDSTGAVLVHLLTPTQKSPPSAGYFAFYGGAGLLLAAALTRTAPAGFASRRLQTLGRHSLFAFVLQYYLYYTGVRLLPANALLPAPVWFALTLAVLVGLTELWNAHDLTNRLITVGLPQLRARGASL